uniref:Uncharacterized protein n=1 Tax=Plectus sambesii TaxID=2011161 RepID=A0A914VVA3_9BILA
MGLTTNFLFALIAIGFVSTLAEDLTKTQDGSMWCPIPLAGTRCPDSSAFHYYKCCGDLNKDCCFNLQTWVIVVLAIIVLCIIASVVAGVIRCICCGR